MSERPGNVPLADYIYDTDDDDDDKLDASPPKNVALDRETSTQDEGDDLDEDDPELYEDEHDRYYCDGERVYTSDWRLDDFRLDWNEDNIED